MAEKVTVMVLKVDLQCPTCYKKIKKLLCKSPQVRDQIFDEKQNLVTISVVSCCPDKIRDKLRRKAGKVIKSIDIPKPKSKEPEKTKTDDNKPKGDAPKPKSDDNKPKGDSGKPKSDDNKPKGDSGKPKSVEPAAKKPAAEKPQALIAEPPAYSVPGIVGPEQYYVQYGYPVVNSGWGYGEPSYEVVPYYNGYGYGRPVPPQPSYNGGSGGYSYGYNNHYSEETPSMCTIV